MPPLDIRQKLHQQIDQLPSDFLLLAAELLESLQSKPLETAAPMKAPSLSRTEESIAVGSTGADLLRFAGTWQGDDFEDCLEAVYEARLPTEL